MEIYGFMRGLLAWIASFAVLAPINIPLLYFAYRALEGRLPEDDDRRMDDDELRKRSILGGLALAGVVILFVFADYVAAVWAALPAGLVHFVILISFIAAGAFTCMLFFAYEDYFNGLGLLVFDLMLPLVVLWAINAVLGVWNNPWTRFWYSWLKEVGT